MGIVPLLVDDRAGSNTLIEPLLKLGLPVESTRLDFGDLCFVGRGEKGVPVLVGVEHKKIPDLIQSLNDARLTGHQLPGMITAYDRAWLIIEGDWKHDVEGRVTMFRTRGARRPVKGAPPAFELEKRLLTLEVRGGLKVRMCPDRRDTLRFIYALYRFWTDRDLDGHRSHLAIHAPDLDQNILVPASDFRRIIAQIPAIGFRTSKAIEAAVWDETKGEGSFRRLMMMSETVLAELVTLDDHGKARRIGNARAQTILEALR
jgi:ERCC4-type nuclease